MSDKLTELKTKMAMILSVGGWKNDTNGLFAIVNRAYKLGIEEGIDSVRAGLDAELNGASILRDPAAMLRDPAAVVDISPIGDKPQGDALLDES